MNKETNQHFIIFIKCVFDFFLKAFFFKFIRYTPIMEIKITIS